MTQAERIVAAIREASPHGMTWGEVLALRISNCPWVRLRPDEKGFSTINPFGKAACLPKKVFQILHSAETKGVRHMPCSCHR